MDLRLHGKTALITGSTAGIGLATATRLVREGAHVAIVGRDRDKLEQAQASIRNQAPNGSIQAILADPATSDGVAVIARELPEVDILVNNLGIYESKEFEAITDADWRRFFEVNVMSGIRFARRYFPAMLQKKWGRIIFIASESALIIPPDMIHYGMTKTAQLAISRGLAARTKGTAVTVNAILPGPTRSEGITAFLKSVVSNPTAPASEMETEFFNVERPASLIQRMIEPSEIADLVAYVASPLSSATNGAALRVDGGLITTIA